MNALILIAEDEPPICEILDAYLTREGFRTVRAGVLRLDCVAIDLNSHMVKIEVNGTAHALPLTLTEFPFLAHMARTPTKAFTRSELVDACLPGSDALERTVDSHISNLRKTLDETGAPGMLSGVRGIGYRLATI